MSPGDSRGAGDRSAHRAAPPPISTEPRRAASWASALALILTLAFVGLASWVWAVTERFDIGPMSTPTRGEVIVVHTVPPIGPEAWHAERWQDGRRAAVIALDAAVETIAADDDATIFVLDPDGSAARLLVLDTETLAERGRPALPPAAESPTWLAMADGHLRSLWADGGDRATVVGVELRTARIVFTMDPPPSMHFETRDRRMFGLTERGDRIVEVESDGVEELTPPDANGGCVHEEGALYRVGASWFLRRSAASASQPLAAPTLWGDPSHCMVFEGVLFFTTRRPTRTPIADPDATPWPPERSTVTIVRGTGEPPPSQYAVIALDVATATVLWQGVGPETAAAAWSSGWVSLGGYGVYAVRTGERDALMEP